SAVGCSTWESFKKACGTLELDDPRRILRRFKLLGHLESSADGRRWSIAPTALVRANFESENPEFILCGQQNGDLLKELEQHGIVCALDQPRGNAPPCVRVQRSGSIDSSGAIESIRSRLGVQIADAEDVALQLATILPDLEQWMLGLRSVPGIVTSLYDWKRFDGRDFVECSLPQQTGLYQMWNPEGEDSSLRTLFYDSGSQTWRQGDWYGLRFLALCHSNQPCLARYDSATARLAVPYSQRWPELYERALVLASGLLPSYQKTEQSLWLIYENVGRELVQQLTQKLDVTCEEATTGA
ncbi:MAG: hypothetical protein SVX43_11130, partial [Cyanobacteriota bacterium]|nr:hypothetical protein [Cyanobacteriota bacterium]